MAIEVWKTLYAEDFDTDKYLYHYTKVDKALKIINSNKLIFSPITKTNDTTEAKLKMMFPSTLTGVNQMEYKERIDEINKYFSGSNPHMRLLCFSRDTHFTKTERKRLINNGNLSNKRRYYDVSGRGFALPRMWAQYADNNEGVCFIFNKKKLVTLLKNNVALYKAENVVYKSLLLGYVLKEKDINKLYRTISMAANGKLIFVNLMKDDTYFVNYNYFQKLDDWKGEQEFRIVAVVDDVSELLFLPDIFNCVEGIVLGEHIDETYEEVIKMMVKRVVELLDIHESIQIKKIYFDNNICRVE